MAKVDYKGENIRYFMCDVYKRNQSEPLEKRLEDFKLKNDLLVSNESDIISLCKKLDLSALYVPLNDLKLAGFLLVNQKYRVIGINEELEALDARFIIAHELAHYIYESKGKKDSELLIATKDILKHDKNKPPHEHDMDYLAAAILVPIEQFMLELDALHIDYRRLKEHTEQEVRKTVAPTMITYLSRRYRVREQLIVRRIAEVSYYAN